MPACILFNRVQTRMNQVTDSSGCYGFSAESYRALLNKIQIREDAFDLLKNGKEVQ